MHSTSFCFLPALLLLCSATSHLGQSISIVPITRRLAYEHHLLQPHRQPALRPRQGDSLDDLRCEDLTDSFDPTCWDTLGMREWMIQWDDDNSKNGSCENDLWANCFLRQAGLLNVTDLRCEQMGNGTCQPDEQVLSNPTVQYIYGAYSIWALQQVMTFIYNDLVGPDGCNTYIKPIYSNLTGIDVDPDATCSNTTATGPDADATGQNLTAIGQDPDFAVSGKMLLGSLLLSDLDPRPFALGLIVSTNISIPGVDNSNITLDQTQDAVGRILKAYLLSFMGNFPLAGYTFMSNNGSLIITD